jgi:hypothetical protein
MGNVNGFLNDGLNACWRLLTPGVCFTRNSDKPAMLCACSLSGPTPIQDSSDELLLRHPRSV